MERLWQERRLELIVFSVFGLIVFTSILMFYRSYSDYSEMMVIHYSMDKVFAYKIIMAISATTLLISLLIIYAKRDYFFRSKEDDTKALEQLLEDIKLSADKDKIRLFKSMLDQKDHREIYPLISKMINDLQESQTFANEANKTKSLFLANMSHEIRTPLNGIVGFTKLLKSTHLDNEQDDFVRTIRQSSEDLIGIVDDILDISKIENGDVELESLHFNIIDEFESVIENYAIEANKKSIDFSLWIDPSFDALYVQSDHKKIKQILFNIISNAIKFTPEEGSIDVAVVHHELSDDHVTVEFMVQDSGIGISDEHKDRIFDAFTQADNSSSRAYGGTGLGLTIATGLVRLLGAKLQLESKLGHGTRLSFVLDMPFKLIAKEAKNKALNVAIYSPEAVRESLSDQHLAKYLMTFEGINIIRFDDFVTCKDAPSETFDLLYIHYDELDKEELQRLVARHGSCVQVVLVTKLNRRKDILDIAPIFSQMIYEPITFSKVQNSLILASQYYEETVKNTAPLFDGLQALVVEDNRVNQKLIAKTLEELGIQSDVAENGQVGVAMYQQKNYDVVFMDIQMPVMNGVTATKKILEYESQEQLAHTPIIAVTTNTLKGDRERYLDAGMDEYIAKPIDANKFITVLKQFYLTVEEAGEVSKKDDLNILLYKDNLTESKIFGAILKKLGYGVDVAKSIEELERLLAESHYRLLLLDRPESDLLYKKIRRKIQSITTPTLLMIGEHVELEPADMQSNVYVVDKVSDFSMLKERIESLVNTKAL